MNPEHPDPIEVYGKGDMGSWAPSQRTCTNAKKKTLYSSEQFFFCGFNGNIKTTGASETTV